MKEFEIIEGNKEECGEKQREKAAKMVDLWGRQYQNAVKDAFRRTSQVQYWFQDDLMKVAFIGVKWIIAYKNLRYWNNRVLNCVESLEEKNLMYQILDNLFKIIGYIRLKNLIITFPIEKEYDGDKWGCKDYFYTMNVLKKNNLENAVGRDEVFNLLWDYVNDDLRTVAVEYMNCISALHKEQTGESLIENGMEEIFKPEKSEDEWEIIK
jgi:hypothetical protein